MNVSKFKEHLKELKEKQTKMQSKMAGYEHETGELEAKAEMLRNFIGIEEKYVTAEGQKKKEFSKWRLL